MRPKMMVDIDDPWAGSDFFKVEFLNDIEDPGDNKRVKQLHKAIQRAVRVHFFYEIVVQRVSTKYSRHSKLRVLQSTGKPDCPAFMGREVFQSCLCITVLSFVREVVQRPIKRIRDRVSEKISAKGHHS